MTAVGENGQVLIEVIPELEQIIGSQPVLPQLSGSAAQNRFNLLFQKFIEVFTTPEHPLVIFLDDLQWSDLASLSLINLLMQDHHHLLLLGAYRDNEVSPTHPFILTVEELKKNQAIVNTSTLSPLSENTVNQLVADTLSCTPDLAYPLTQLVFQKTQGNPFFTTQFLKALHGDGYIAFDVNQRYWQCDIAQIKTLTLSNDVVEFMAQQLQKLPDQTQQVLKLAACIGNQFDLNTLAIVSEQSTTEAATALWKVLQDGLILPTSQIYKFFQDAEVTEADVNPIYRFLHDRVQQAGYSLIPDDQKKATHLKIGQLLRHNLSQTEQEDKLFDIVSHLNRGQAFITQRQEQEDLAKLNLKAGTKARNTTAYAAAREYLQTGIALLERHCWQHQYELALDLYVSATEASYLNSDFAEMEQLASMVLQQAQTIVDKVKIYEIQIAAQASQSQIVAAIAVGRNALAQLGVEFPTEAEGMKIEQALQAVKVKLRGREIADLIDLPLMSDRTAQAGIQLLGMLFAPVLLASPELLPLLGTTMVQLSLEFGNAPESTVGYAIHGMVLCSFWGDVELGYEFGSLALSLLEKLNAQTMKCMNLNLFAGFIHHHRQAFSEGLPLLKECYRSGMETGVFFYAAYGIQGYGYTALFIGMNLDELAAELDVYSTSLAQIKQESALVYLNMLRQTVHNLRETVSQPDRLIGTFYDETEQFPKHQQDGDLTGITFAHIYKLQLAYSFGNYQAALDYCTQGKTYLVAVSGAHHVPIFHFYAALTYLALAPAQPDPSAFLNEAETHHKALHLCAHNAPMNHFHKWYLVQAEKHRVMGENAAAMECYDQAIHLAKAHQYMNEAALANELTARFYLAWGKDKVAAGYMQDAYYGYAQWGAKAKIDALEQRYPHLLCPILQQAAVSLNVFEALASISSPHVSIQPTTLQNQSFSTSVHSVLDFATILKASQTLSSTIQLEDLVDQLTQIILQNSGADLCTLILPNAQEEWEVRAIATPEGTQLCHMPLPDVPDLPTKLIYYVKHAKEAVIIDDSKTDLPVVDEYFNQYRSRSGLCLPILNQGQLIGILYLNNRLTRGVFTRDRILILNFLCTQAAISLENARLYQQAQTYAQQLEQSQLQIVRSAKMASLGNLVAGVAHEINNPLSFLNGSINNAKDYVQDLFNYITLYQQHHPNAAGPVQDKAEEIDLEFLREDFPKLLNSMEGATARIAGISTSLRTFSRADTEYKVSANLHDGLDSTLLILKYRLKANEHRPTIAVIQDYGDLPSINCFPGQLNQVFMNILANAIDMFDEMAQSQSFAELNAHPQHITIRTTVDSDQVQIQIGDNGRGMTEELQTRIFDHLFTTKSIGKGTGLGLAIARQIVVENHGGSLTVQSALGQGTQFCIRLPIGVK